jgi:hypothetical protein
MLAWEREGIPLMVRTSRKHCHLERAEDFERGV